MLPGVFSEERGGFSLGGIREGQPLAVNIVGNRCVMTECMAFRKTLVLVATTTSVLSIYVYSLCYY